MGFSAVIVSGGQVDHWVQSVATVARYCRQVAQLPKKSIFKLINPSIDELIDAFGSAALCSDSTLFYYEGHGNITGFGGSHKLPYQHFAEFLDTRKSFVFANRSPKSGDFHPLIPSHGTYISGDISTRVTQAGTGFADWLCSTLISGREPKNTSIYFENKPRLNKSEEYSSFFNRFGPLYPLRMDVTVSGNTQWDTYSHTQIHGEPIHDSRLRELVTLPTLLELQNGLEMITLLPRHPVNHQ